MQIVCPNCTTSYEIAASALGNSGRIVRCVRCHEQWFAQAPELETAFAGDARIEPRFQEEQRFDHQQESELVTEQAGAGWASSGGWTAEPDEEAAHDAATAARLSSRDDELEFRLPDDIVAVSDAPATAPHEDYEFADEHAEPVAPEAARAPAEPDFFELQRRRKIRAKQKVKKRGPRVTAPRLVAVMVGIIIGLVFERVNVVRLLPQTATLYGALGMHINLRGLVFDDVKTTMDVQDGVPIMIIEGAIHNVTRDIANVPRLRFAMRNTAGADIYAWTALPEKPTLAAGQTMQFRSRLASPPTESRGAYVRFIQRRDIVAAAN